LVQANLISNPGFETGDFTGWTLGGAGSVNAGVQCGNPSFPAHSGNCAADLGTGPATLSQTLTTVPGGSYSLDFWLELTQPGGANDSFSVSWGGSTIFSLSSGQTTPFPYTHEIFSSLTATASSTTLIFSGAGQASHVYLVDDVNAVSNASTPEPSTAAALAIGLGMLVSVLRLRRPATHRQLEQVLDQRDARNSS
jgi:hypothetical protein